MSLLKDYKTLRQYRSDPLKFMRDNFKKNGHVTHLKIFGKEIFIVSHPDDVIYVLKTNHAAYTKGRSTKALQELLGNGLVTNDDMESWRKQHRLIRPTMNLKSVYQLAPKMLETTLSFLPELTSAPEVNAFRQMNRLTWRIVLQTLFSQEVTQEMDDWLEDILELMECITHRTRSSVPIPYWIPIKRHRRLKQILSKFDSYVYKLIKQRREGERKQDLLQLLITAQEEGLTKMTDLEIRDEVMTFLLAGHETITNSMSWLLIELAKNKGPVEKLRADAQIFFETKNYEALNASPCYSAVIDESMRLWPAIWVFMRQAEKEDTVGGHKIPVGANVVIAPCLTHRAPELWENPDEFRPERFLEKRKLPAGAYYPFGMGPRACIGAYFAGVEAKIILASIVQHFDWEIRSVKPQEYVAGITLRPDNNLMMSFKRR
ncbi:MAG TPA: cytochrome P450 [Bacteriovoracaceae bacterium]|nr:cytochrome P450 [Bacteriovoracaceae bacterium]